MTLSILLAAQAYPPDIGGEERHVYALARGLAQRGHRVTVATQTLNGRESDTIEPPGIRVLRLASAVTSFKDLAIGHGTRPNAPPVPDPVLRRRLRPLLDDVRPDIVHAHNWIVYSIAPLAAKRSIPVVLTLHNYGYVCATHRYMYLGHSVCTGPRLDKCVRCAMAHYGSRRGLPVSLALRPSRELFLVRNLAHVMAVSQSVASRSRLSKGAVPWSVVPNFIPEALIRKGEAGTEDQNSKPIVYVGDLHADKGVDILFEAYARLDPTTRPQLACMGRNALSSSQRIPVGVTINPPAPHEEAMALMRSSRFVVVPSVFPDPCPTTVLEAMAAGRAVVASASGGVIDQVASGETGFLVPPGDGTALRSALAAAIADPTRIEAMGRAGLARARRFCDATVIPRIESVYDEAIARGGEFHSSSTEGVLPR